MTGGEISKQASERTSTIEPTMLVELAGHRRRGRTQRPDLDDLVPVNDEALCLLLARLRRDRIDGMLSARGAAEGVRLLELTDRPLYAVKCLEDAGAGGLLVSGEDEEDCEDGDGREDEADAGCPAVGLGEEVGRWCFRIRVVEQAFSRLLHPACALS